jgi:hypothetical protein
VARNAVEFCIESIIDYLQANLPGVLNSIYADRDKEVSLETPFEYFTYEKAIGYKTPAIFVVARDIDYRMGLGANHVNALITVYIGCVIEDRNSTIIQKRIFRYQDALQKTLHRTVLADTNATQKNIIKVTGASFSQTEASHSAIDSVFRKEVLLTLEIEHYELEGV